MTPAARMPDWLEPMAATLTQDRFIGPDWLFERKFDGIRLLAPCAAWVVSELTFGRSLTPTGRRFSLLLPPF